MSLLPGTRVGPYEIVGAVGAGGMGEVYRARDTRLKRDVAIKALPETFASDPERLARFQREAEVLASLNHPNIAHIHGLEEAGRVPPLVMEFVEGEDLAQKIARGPIELDQALAIAGQMAEALEAAHECGIIHRDLKPANIKITPAGDVKVLDFGLAKAIEAERPAQDLANSSTITSVSTKLGVILGTAAYMSPEQAKGKTVDKRADIWAFGCVLFEMLSGRPAFAGDTATEVIANVLTRQPQWDALPAGLPAPIQRVIRRCLEKDPKRRLRDIGDARNELESHDLDNDLPESGAMPVWSMSRRGWFVLMSAPLAAAFWAGRYLGRSPSPVPSYHRLTFRRGNIWSARFAPDGKTLLYSATWQGSKNQIYSTRQETPESRPLGHPDADVLAVSPSGELAIALQPSHAGGFILGTLARVDATGVAPRPIRENVVAADWGPDGKTLAIVRSFNGKYRLDFPLDNTLYETANRIVEARVRHDATSVAFCEGPSVCLVDLDGKKRVLSTGWAGVYSVVWSPAGDEVWFTASELASGRTTAGIFGVTLRGRLRTMMRLPVGVTLRDVSRDGRLLLTTDGSSKGIHYRIRATGEERDLSWFDWSLVADISADGTTLLFSEGGRGGGAGRSVYMRKLDGSPAVRLGNGTAQAFSPDGTMALALEESGRVVRLTALPTGPGSPKILTDDQFSCLGAGWFPDGKRILFCATEAGRHVRTYILDMDRGSIGPVTRDGVAGSLVSPDGAWFLASLRGQPTALYPVSGNGPRAIPGLTAADQAVQWDSDGRFAYFRRDFQPEHPDAISVFRIDLTTGHRELWAHLLPQEFARAADLLLISIAADGQAFAYTYIRDTHDLYLVEWT